jgi:hypothetical protein
MSKSKSKASAKSSDTSRKPFAEVECEDFGPPWVAPAFIGGGTFYRDYTRPDGAHVQIALEAIKLMDAKGRTWSIDGWDYRWSEDLDCVVCRRSGAQFHAAFTPEQKSELCQIAWLAAIHVAKAAAQSARTGDLDLDSAYWAFVTDAIGGVQ